MNEVSKISELKPASFEGKDRLTREQRKLLELLKEKIHSNLPITRNDILEFYITNIKKSPTYKNYARKWDAQYRGYSTDFNDYDIRFWKDKYGIMTLALQWFKNNLGAVIIKGKVLIIPVIELNENERTEKEK